MMSAGVYGIDASRFAALLELLGALPVVFKMPQLSIGF
jgi:hypothetical protein